MVYEGDKTLAIKRPHGNSKKERPFIRIAKDTIDLVKSKNSAGSVMKQYECCKSATLEMIPDGIGEEEKDKFILHHTPRNSQMIKNCRKSMIIGTVLSLDEFYGGYILGKSELENEVHFYQVLPDLVIILGSRTTVELTNRIFSQGEREKQILSYDTTFNLGNYYVSILCARNTELVGDPIFPIVFMIYGKKHEGVHNFFWNNFVNKKLKITKHICIVTDRKKSIVNAIRSSGYLSNHLFCYNHIVSDVKIWLRKTNANLKDSILYRSIIEQLLNSETREDFDVSLIYDDLTIKKDNELRIC